MPVSIQREMRMFANGMMSMPDSYIEFHRKLAMEALATDGFPATVFGSIRMENDGWGDGFRAVSANIITDEGTPTISWHDGNEEFFITHASGGSSPLRLETAKTINDDDGVIF